MFFTRRSQTDSRASRDRKAMPASLCWALGIFALLCLPSRTIAQVGGVNQGGPESVHAPAGMNPLPQKGVPESVSQIERMRQAERSRRLASDTARLLQLSTELKADIDRSSNQLSLDTLRKAAEIEKLARDVQSWIKQ